MHMFAIIGNVCWLIDYGQEIFNLETGVVSQLQDNYLALGAFSPTGETSASSTEGWKVGP